MNRRAWAAALLLGFGPNLGCERPMPASVFREATDVVVALPMASEVTDYEEFTGQTDAILSVQLRARVTGYLLKRDFLDGAEVKEGDLLYEIDDRPYKAMLDKAAATVAKAEAHRKRLEADYNRASHLFKRAAIGRAEFDLVASDFAESEASLNAAKAQRDLAQQEMDYTRIRAPMSGQISRTLVDPGNLILQADTILTDIVAADKLYVYFDLNEETLNKVRGLIQGGLVRAPDEKDVPVLVGLSDEETFSHPGKVNFSENKVDAATGTLRIRGIIDNPKPWILSPGLFVRVRLPIGSPHPTLLVPEEAVGSDQGRRFVYVINAQDQVIYKPVEVGATYEGKRSIRSGLAADERIVVAGLQRVRPGSLVSPKMALSDKPAAEVKPDARR